MRAQLRDYRIKPGELDAWVEEWRAKVAPLRRKMGFEVVAAWRVDADDRFVWILRHTGAGSWEDADRAYYDSPERKAMHPDPARHIAHHEERFVETVDEA